MDNEPHVLLNTQDNVDIITDVKGLFQDSEAIKKQYKEGMMGRTAGFDFFENTLLNEVHLRVGRERLHGERRGQTGAAITVQRGARHVQEGRHRHLRGLQPGPPGNQGGHGRAADLRHHGGLRRRRGQHRRSRPRSSSPAPRRT
jgi:hypothetical protein